MSDNRLVGITTEDNPYDVFNEFDQWYAYDESHGYHTCAYLARVCDASISLSDKDNAEAIELAIDEIVRIHNGYFYKKIVEKDYSENI